MVAHSHKGYLMASTINPNNIDGSYPVSGQDNNSQGFRDNFTNIRTNFGNAAVEINDLQNKVLLRAPLTGSNVALTSSNDLNGTGPIIGALIRNFGGNKVSIAATSGAIAVNYSQGHYQSITTSGSISLSFTNNWPANNTYGYIKLQLNITNTAHTVTLPAAVTLGTDGIQGLSGNVLSFATAGVYEFAFGSYDSGTTITVFDLNRALTNFTAADLQVDDVTATGNIVAGFGGSGFISATGNVLSGQQFIATGNVVGGNISTLGVVSSSGNVIGGNITTMGSVSATGNVNSNFSNARMRPSIGTGAIAALQFTAGDLLSTPAAGAFEYDGVSFYTTATANQRSIVPGTQFVMTPGLSPYTLTQNTLAQKIFSSPTNGEVQLNASTTYMFEALYVISNTATPSAAHSVSLQFALGGGGSISSISYAADVTTSSGAPSAGATALTRTFSTSVGATQITPSGTTTNSEFITVRLQGVVRTNAAGSFTPQIKYNTNQPGGTSTVQGNSYFKLIPVGTSSVISVGNWS
jgi:hypothetical protein